MADVFPAKSVAVELAIESDERLPIALEATAALSVAEAFALSVAEADSDAVSVLFAELPVAVAVGRELESVMDPGSAPVALSAAPVGVVEASVAVAGMGRMVVVSEASEAEALERRVDISEANEAETALPVAVAATLESCDSRDKEMLDKALPASVAVGALEAVWVAPVVWAEAADEVSVSRADCADEAVLDRPSEAPMAVALESEVAPSAEAVIPMGRRMRGVVELWVEIEGEAVESPAVVARRGKISVVEVEAVVALLPLS